MTDTLTLFMRKAAEFEADRLIRCPSLVPGKLQVTMSKDAYIDLKLNNHVDIISGEPHVGGYAVHVDAEIEVFKFQWNASDPQPFWVQEASGYDSWSVMAKFATADDATEFARHKSGKRKIRVVNTGHGDTVMELP